MMKCIPIYIYIYIHGSVKHMLVTCLSLPVCRSFGSRIQGLRMKLWHAIGIQLLSVLLREQSKPPAADPDIDRCSLTCNCTGIEDPFAGRYYPLSLVLAGLGVGLAIGALVTSCVVLRKVSHSSSDDSSGGRGSRRRGGGVLSVPQAGNAGLSLVQ